MLLADSARSPGADSLYDNIADDHPFDFHSPEIVDRKDSSSTNKTQDTQSDTSPLVTGTCSAPSECKDSDCDVAASRTIHQNPITPQLFSTNEHSCTDLHAQTKIQKEELKSDAVECKVVMETQWFDNDVERNVGEGRTLKVSSKSAFASPSYEADDWKSTVARNLGQNSPTSSGGAVSELSSPTSVTSLGSYCSVPSPKSSSRVSHSVFICRRVDRKIIWGGKICLIQQMIGFTHL